MINLSTISNKILLHRAIFNPIDLTKEEGRGLYMGIQTPTQNEQPIDVGVLNPHKEADKTIPNTLGVKLS